MEITQRAIAEIKPYPGNPRKISEKAVKKVAASLQEFGWQQPIVIDKNGVIIVGHTRLLAAKSLGWNDVPCVTADLTPEQASTYRIADNRTNEENEWDNERLRQELDALTLKAIDLSGTGFDAAELKKIFTIEPPAGASMAINPIFQIIITCANETEQLSLLGRLQKDNIKARALIA